MDLFHLLIGTAARCYGFRDWISSEMKIRCCCGMPVVNPLEDVYSFLSVNVYIKAGDWLEGHADWQHYSKFADNPILLQSVDQEQEVEMAESLPMLVDSTWLPDEVDIDKIHVDTNLPTPLSILVEVSETISAMETAIQLPVDSTSTKSLSPAPKKSISWQSSIVDECLDEGGVLGEFAVTNNLLDQDTVLDHFKSMEHVPPFLKSVVTMGDIDTTLDRWFPTSSDAGENLAWYNDVNISCLCQLIQELTSVGPLAGSVAVLNSYFLNSSAQPGTVETNNNAILRR